MAAFLADRIFGPVHEELQTSAALVLTNHEPTIILAQNTAPLKRGKELRAGEFLLTLENKSLI